MQPQNDDNDSSNIFWPGYVDATTNLVLNLLFLLTIMIVAVFMFALELGRTVVVESDTPPITSTQQKTNIPPETAIAAVKENKALKLEIQQLEKKLEELTAKKQVTEVAAKTATDAAKENKALKLEIQELKKKLDELTATKQKADDTAKSATASIKENIELKLEIQQLNKKIKTLTAAKEKAEAAAKTAAEAAKENKALKLEIQQLKSKLEELEAAKKEAEAANKAAAEAAEEIKALKLEVQKLNTMLAKGDPQKPHAGGLEKSAQATAYVPQPKRGLDKTLSSDAEIIVRFKDEAIALTTEEHDELLTALKPIADGEKASIYVEVPTGFSEAKRMGFYRAMAVRNLLLEMNMSKEKIDVLVVEEKNNANASLVKVRPQ